MPLNPYHFVPAPPECAVSGEPRHHDLFDPTGRWTGELCCDMTALTPLLAANDQYHFEDANDDVRRAFERIVNARGPGAIDNDKTFLEPLIVDGRVVIGGPAIKGAIRSAWGSLLSSPMERVAERTFSYRPNVRLSAGDDLLQTGVGVVSHTSGNDVVILPLDYLTDLVYVTDPALRGLLRVWGLTEVQLNGRIAALQVANGSLPFATRAASLRPNLTVPDCTIREQRGCAKFVSDPGASQPLASSFVLPYRFGLDGRGVFHQAHQAGRPAYRYALAVLPNSPVSLTIDSELIQHWRETLTHLADKETGHLLGHPKLKKTGVPPAVANINRLIADGWRPGDIIFFEREKTGARRVRTIGHHFRYRWRYRDTIRESDGQPRAELIATAAERQPKPSQLTASRSLFGYVAAGDADAITLGIGKDDFAMFAGRIALNHAVERDHQRPDRFLNAEHACLVPLWPLGSPKPSAVKHYLVQEGVHRRADKGTLRTYGDDATDTNAGALRGRKVYLHQPDAADHASVYEMVDPQGDDAEMLRSNQASVARFVSKPGATFGFKIRFVDLEDWELGGLLFTLSPRLDDVRPMLTKFKDAWSLQVLKQTLDRIDVAIRAKPGQPGLAHKIGHGRPLGMGSVTIEVKRCERIRFDADHFATLGIVESWEERRSELIQAFWDKVLAQLGVNAGRWVKDVLVRWLKVRRYAGRTWCDYPRPDGGGPIFDYHTRLRGKHIAGRKQQKQTDATPQGLTEPD